MISLDMIKRGYLAGIINLIDSPHGDGVVCEIGDNWFYFGGETAAEMTAKDYKRDIPLEDTVRSIFQVLEDFRKEGDVFEDEYLYYEAFLNENLKLLPVDGLQVPGVDERGFVRLSLNDGTLLAESMLASAVRNMEHARDLISEVNKGTYEFGQTPLRFDCESSPALSEDMEDLVKNFVKLVEAARMDVKVLAAQIVQESPSMSGEIFRLVEKDYYKEDIVGKLEDKGIDVDSVTDNELCKMAERFENILSHNDGYWESYWLSAEAAIDEVVQENSKDEKENAPGAGWNSIDEMVDMALTEIKGVGEWAGSGLYGLRDFEVDGERMELVVEICRFEDKEANREYYGVYYWVGYYGDDSLWADWKYTDMLDVDELKEVVMDLNNTDFTEDIRKAIKENSVEAMIGDAKERCVDAGTGENKAQECVKE